MVVNAIVREEHRMFHAGHILCLKINREGAARVSHQANIRRFFA